MVKQAAKELGDEGENAIFSEDESQSEDVTPKDNRDTIIDQDNMDI
jgi:hypothetical protein